MSGYNEDEVPVVPLIWWTWIIETIRG